MSKVALYTDLVPNASQLIPKTVYCGISPELTHYLMLEYLKRNKYWFKDESKYREIAFSINYLTSAKNGQIYIKDYIKRNYFFCYLYNDLWKPTLDQFSGYENVVIGDAFCKKDLSTFDYLKELEETVKYILSNNQKIYYLIPDYIFEADDNTYSENTPANTAVSYKEFAYAKFFDQYLSFLRDYKKLPIYRIVVPRIINFKKLNMFVHKTELPKVKSSKDDYDKILSIERPLLSTDKFAEALYNLHLESEPKNYIISSDIKFSERELNTFNPIINKKEVRSINLDNSWLESTGFENYDLKWYNENINQLIKEQKYNNKAIKEPYSKWITETNKK